MQWLINYGLSSEKMVGNSRVFASWGFELSMCRVKDEHCVTTSVNVHVFERCTGGWDIEYGNCRMPMTNANDHGVVSAVEDLQALARGSFPRTDGLLLVSRGQAFIATRATPNACFSCPKDLSSDSSEVLCPLPIEGGFLGHINWLYPESSLNTYGAPGSFSPHPHPPQKITVPHT